MEGTLKHLLRSVIDYAGLFPPAKLDMASAVDQYFRYVDGSDDWLIGRFVCPAALLPELTSCLTTHSRDEIIEVSVIGSPSKDRPSWEDALVQDAQTMSDFQEKMDDVAEIAAYEIRVPDHDDLKEFLVDLRGFAGVERYIELPWGPQMNDSLAMLAEAEEFGAKARLGSTEKSGFPEIGSVAGFIKECASLDLPFKLTAGLHHPLPHLDAALGVKMFGFLNILTALGLTIQEELAVKEIEEILKCEVPEAWTFTDKSLQWQDRVLSLDDLDAVRDLFVSYGSCSIAEPLEDLRSFGFLTH